MGRHALLQGTFPDQDWTQVSCLLHWQADSLPLSHQESPIFLFWTLLTSSLKLESWHLPPRTIVRIKGKNILKIFYVHIKFSGCTWSFKITSFHSELGYQFKLSKPIPDYFNSRFKNAFSSSTNPSVSVQHVLIPRTYSMTISPCSSHQIEWAASRLPPLVILPNDSPWVIASPA